MEIMLFDESKFNQAVKLASTLAKSSIVPKHFQGKGQDVFAALVLGAELGFQPMQALQAIVMIQGQCTLKAQTQLALVRARCPRSIIEITESGDEVSCYARRDEKDLGYKATWSFKRALDSGFVTAWDKELKKMKTKDNWVKQPLVMSRWRAISEALRTVFPDVLMGIYATEEMQDIDVTPEKSLIQIMNESAEIDNPIPEEEKTVGPLYRFQNSKFRGKQFYELSVDVLEEFADDLVKRKSKKPWEVALESTIRSYLVNYDAYTEQLAELRAEDEAVES